MLTGATATPATEHNRQIPLATSVLIGRDNELARLRELAGTPPSLAIVVGEAGIGKTRLVRELIDHPALDEDQVLVGHCYRMRDPFPLGPVVEALRSTEGKPPCEPLSAVVGALRPLLPELAHNLPRRPKPLGDPQAERHRVFRGLRELLGALGPAVCVLEDLHWADEGTLEFLRFLACNQPQKLTLVLTCRREDAGLGSAIEALVARNLGATSKALVELSALSCDEVRSLVCATLETEVVSEKFAQALHDRTGGIPFAVEEVLRLIQERGEVALVSGVSPERALDRLDVPPALRYSIFERLESLAGDARLVARAAGVLGRPASEELISKVAGLRPVRGARGVTEALSCALLEEKQKGLYGFRHALLAQAVYEHIPGPDRRRLHLRAAQALASVPEPCPLAQVAHHYKEVGRRAQWLQYSEVAADAASSHGDDRTAVRIIADVLVADDLPRATRMRMALKLGDAALFGRVPEHAIANLERALAERLLPSGVRGELRFSLARLMHLAGDGSSAYRQMVRAAGELKRRPGLAARAMATLAAVLPVQGNADEHMLWLHRALKADARQEDPVVTTDVLGSRAEILLELGDPAGWQAVEDIPWNASSVEQKLELVRACKYLARAALLLGHFERAQSFLDRADRIRRELGHARFGVGLATVRAQLDWSTGRWEGLEERARRLVESSAEGPVISGASELILAWLGLARGDVEDAEQGFDSVLNVFQDARERWHFASAANGLARIHLGRGDLQAACEVATLGLGASGETGTWTWTYPLAPVAVEALVACGAVDEARDVTHRLARGLRGRDAPAARAALAVTRGVIAEADGRRDEAVRRFGQAERAWRRLPCPYEAAQALERRARCLLAGGETIGGDCLLSALEAYGGLGAGWDSARIRAALRTYKVTLPHPWRGGRKGYGEELSPREREVAHLAGTGKTNREIAEALVISSRTVENHVAAAMRKRAVTSRRELGLAPELAMSSAATEPSHQK